MRAPGRTGVDGKSSHHHGGAFAFWAAVLGLRARRIQRHKTRAPHCACFSCNHGCRPAGLLLLRRLLLLLAVCVCLCRACTPRSAASPYKSKYTASPSIPAGRRQSHASSVQIWPVLLLLLLSMYTSTHTWRAHPRRAPCSRPRQGSLKLQSTPRPSPLAAGTPPA